MSTRLHVSNLAWATTEDGLRRAFESNGHHLDDAVIIVDPDGGRSRGFGFVEVSAADSAAIIEQMNGVELDGRMLRVAIANPRRARVAA